MTNVTHYEVLKIESNASADEIKRAYYKLVRQFPPERFPNEFRTVREAYDVLSNDERRKQYDDELEINNKLAGDLPVEAIEEIERIKTEIQRAHTGSAVKAAENLYAQYPGNAAVILLLAQAYLARGWTNKAMNFVMSPEYQNTLKTSGDWDAYTSVLELTGVSETKIFEKTVEGISVLSENGEDDIDMCAWAYYTFSQFGKKELSELAFPERFDSAEKILYYISALSERGLKTKESEAFIAHVLTPIIDYKKPSDLNGNDMKQLKIIIEIIRNVVDARELMKSQFKKIIENIEYIIEQKSEPEYRTEPVRAGEKIGRNAPCPCGSGKKYKKCCAR